MNIYQDIYDIIIQYIYNNAEITAHMDLVAVTLSTIGCIFVFAVPFIVIWRLIRIICG